MWLPLLALFIGFSLAFAFRLTLPPESAKYMGVAIIAGLDSVVGGLRARAEGKFDDAVFMTGFFVNALLAAVLAYIGDKLGINLALVAAIVFGMRIFQNLSTLRRYVLNDLRRRRSAHATPPDHD